MFVTSAYQEHWAGESVFTAKIPKTPLLITLLSQPFLGAK